ncbi:HEAT repeat domain-containing protein [Kitasatospora sp. MBT63]|uniref:HEAT repeat domain-containing protein n=1 Tax=Kitasatospora sp. MBT63 TaxID=1444768 RepID=UPI00053B252E|nr:HEAT repeat domain-containing protein [Kitasatospora sp. MBT63]
MTPEERQLVLSLGTVPGGGPEVGPEDVLHHFGATDGKALSLSLLCDAADRKDAADADVALVACYRFGFTANHLAPLIELATADWHHRHEDVVTALGELRSPAAVDALYHATQWVPEYLDYDENRGLATKAVRALAATPGAEAERALVRLTEADDETVREAAVKHLARRRSS